MYWERALLHEWKLHKHGTIIGVPNATINFWDLRYSEYKLLYNDTPCSLPLPDKVALHGSMAKKNTI
jgi:hypothetical protein